MQQTQLEILEAEALKLTPGERAALAQRLLASLDEDADIEEAWVAEVERRIADVESGSVQVIPIAEALTRVRAACVLPGGPRSERSGSNEGRS
jgi:putative addiction module component (TIGR02574 family)